MNDLFDSRLPDRFWDKISPEPNSGCWLWLGYTQPNGYGQYRLPGKTQMAHRAAFRILVGEVPTGLDLDHLCRVRCCVNPNHLEPVTRSVNLKRGKSHGGRAYKTHCKRGHPLLGDNLKLVPGGRECRACRRIHDKQKYLRKKNRAQKIA
ncbi:MAG: HNH endonuclease signature motif containing protein [Gammaproteobacteria bacterium]